jgi:hypothetical protein
LGVGRYAATVRIALVRRPLAACAPVVLAGALLAGVCSVAALAAPASGPGLKKVHDPGRVTGTLHGHCSYREHGQLPDPRCTPGSIDPAVTQASIRSTICKKGWTATVRPPESQTQRFKYQVAYPAYGDPGSKRTELDHLVPLELGGSNDATNLWPESPPVPNPKDTVERVLNEAVCAGRVSLTAAQSAIASDWLTAEKKLGLGGPGGGTGGGGKAWCTASASYNTRYGDYDIYVHSNQPDQTVTATASNGASHSYHTNASGYADVFLRAGSGNAVTVTVGAASCSTTT